MITNSKIFDMNNSFYKIALGLFLAVSALGQQAILSPSEFSTLPPKEADSRLTNYDGSKGRKILDEYLSSVIASGNIELVKVFLENRRTSYLVSAQISSLPDGPFRDAVVIMILRSESPTVWDNIPYEQRVGSKPLKNTMILEPFRTTIKKFLPQLALDDNTIFDSPKRRLKLVDELEAAMRQASSQSETLHENGTKEQGRRDARSQFMPPNSNLIESLGAGVLPDKVEVSSSALCLKWTMGIIIAIGLLCVLIKKMKP